jgi:UPF0716 protein FxsA
MRSQNSILFAILLWLGLELLAFAFVVHVAGLSGAILFGLLTSLTGLAVLRRLGFSAALGLKNAMRGHLQNSEISVQEAMLDGSLAAFGAVLLILPGFVSDVVGLGLVAPSIRTWVATRLQYGKLGSDRKASGAGPSIIELSPQEWTRLDEPPGKSR